MAILVLGADGRVVRCSRVQSACRRAWIRI